jgi:hypothetical protein
MVVTGLLERLCVDELDLVPLRGSRMSSRCNALEHPPSSADPPSTSFEVGAFFRGDILCGSRSRVGSFEPLFILLGGSDSASFVGR